MAAAQLGTIRAARPAGRARPFVSPLRSWGACAPPAPPRPPHANLPGEQKRPRPRAPRARAPSLPSSRPPRRSPNFPSGRSASARVAGRGPPTADTQSPLPAGSRSPARAYLARSLRRPLRVRRQIRPFARCEPCSGPPTAGVRLPDPDPLGPNARAAARVARPRVLSIGFWGVGGNLGRGGARGAILRPVQDAFPYLPSHPARSQRYPVLRRRKPRLIKGIPRPSARLPARRTPSLACSCSCLSGCAFWVVLTTSGLSGFRNQRFFQPTGSSLARQCPRGI